MAERRRDAGGAGIRRGVHVTSAVHRGLERHKQRPQAGEVGSAHEDLAHGERTALPRPLSRKGGRNPGAKGPKRADAVTP